ncbi:MAG: GatB/YqeY domain-containing protein [Bacteroidia bacterium]|nr:GatB/YqeY domain-containing protein [Bacteroidia bacterium]
MSLKATLNDDLKEAMKAKDQVALRTIRAIKSAIMLAETSEGHIGEALSEAEELKILTKQAKQRKDSAEQFKANGRDDLAQTEEEELQILERYLPKAMTQEELQAAISSLIAELGVTSIKDMGKVMGQASQRFAGKADGKVISEIVKQQLA